MSFTPCLYAPAPGAIIPERDRVEYLHEYVYKNDTHDIPTSIIKIPRNPLKPNIKPKLTCDYCTYEPAKFGLSILLTEIRSWIEEHPNRMTYICEQCKLSKLKENPKHCMFVVLCGTLCPNLSRIIMEYLRSPLLPSASLV